MQDLYCKGVALKFIGPLVHKTTPAVGGYQDRKIRGPLFVEQNAAPDPFIRTIISLYVQPRMVYVVGPSPTETGHHNYMLIR
jgi:hypothetical protein